MDKLDLYYKQSLLANLCKEYKGMWQKAHNDKERLITLAMGQQAIPHVATFAYEGKGVTKDYLLKEFGEYLNGCTICDADGVDGYTYGMYVDYDYDNDLIVDKDVSHIMWTKGAILVVPSTKCPIVYISNKSDVALICEGYNSVKVYVFDESRVTIEDADESCTITVFKYSDKAKAVLGDFCLSKEVKVFNKELRI